MDWHSPWLVCLAPKLPPSGRACVLSSDINPSCVSASFLLESYAYCQLFVEKLFHHIMIHRSESRSSFQQQRSTCQTSQVIQLDLCNALWLYRKRALKLEKPTEVFALAFTSFGSGNKWEQNVVLINYCTRYSILAKIQRYTWLAKCFQAYSPVIHFLRNCQAHSSCKIANKEDILHTEPKPSYGWTGYHTAAKDAIHSVTIASSLFCIHV